MGREADSYRSIFKGISVFGGVQMFHILASVVRVKLVALLLGPAGMGVAALYTSSTSMVQRFASLGLNLSIVKEAGGASGDPDALGHVVAVARRMTLLTGLLGALVCVLFSEWFSEVSFGDRTHVVSYVILSAMVFFTVAGNGELSLLQGVRDVRRLSRATIVGSVTGLCVSVPLYWIFGQDGIAPAMTVLAFAVWAFYAWSGRRSITSPAVRFVWRTHRTMVVRLVMMGLVLMASDMIGTGVQYLIQVFIRTHGDVSHVGLYSGANSLTLQYAGVVFAAMAMDYLPRLSGVAGDDRAMCGVINRQIEMVCYLITPLAGAMVVFAPLVVRLLLTSGFADSITLLRIMGLALIFRAMQYPLGYVAFAKNNRKVFFWLEGVLNNVITLGVAVGGYALWGLDGLGWGMVSEMLISIAIYYVFTRHMYGYRASRGAVSAALYASLIGIAVFVSVLGLPEIPGMVVGCLLLAGAALASFRIIRDRLRREKSETTCTES